MTLWLIIGLAFLALGCTALFYRMLAVQHKADAERQKVRAEHAEASVEQRQALDQSLEKIGQKHRQETIDETKPEHLAARNDFNNDWSDGLSGDPAAADQSDSAAATGSPGASAD